MRKKYDSLNGMRAYAAIAILAMHVLENSEYTGIASTVSTKVDILKWLIYLFMIISGFSLCCGYYERILHQSIAIVEFYKKRYKKILPFFTLLVFMDCMTSLSLNSVVEGIADITLVYALLPNAIGSLIFMLPGTAMYTVGTAGLADKENRLLYIGIAVVLAVVVTIIGIILKKRYLKDDLEENKE